MKKFFLRGWLVLAFLGVVGLCPAVGQQFEWAQHMRQVGNTAANYYAAATDLDGNTYMAIDYRDSIRVGTQLWSGPGQVLVKHNAAGQVEWVKQLLGLRIDLTSLCADKLNGEVFFRASVTGTATWQGVAVGAAASLNFYGKFSNRGNLLWTGSLPGRIVDWGVRGVTTDVLGNFYIYERTTAASEIVGTLTVAPYSSYVVQITPAGTIGWTRQLHTIGGTSTLQVIGGLGQRLAGGCLLLGSLQNSATGVTFGAANPLAALSGVTYQNEQEIMLSIDATGTLQWAGPIDISTGANFSVFDAATDLAGNIYASGMSNPNGIVVAKYGPTGNRLWEQLQQTLTGGNPNSGYWLAVDPAGQHVSVIVTGSLYRLNGYWATIAGLTLRSENNNIVRFNGQGQPMWAVSDTPVPGTVRPNSPVTGGSTSLDSHHIGLDRAGNIYCAGVLTPRWYDLRPYIVLGNQTLVGGGLFVAKINTGYNLLTGRVYLDANNNGNRDAGEGDFPLPVVLDASQTTTNAGSSFGTSLTNGPFTMYVDSGAYSLRIPNIPLHYTLTQPTASSGAYTGHFRRYGLTDSLRYFGLHPDANAPDLRVVLTPYTAARRGVVNRLRLTIENVGTTTAPAGIATVVLDSRMLYIGSVPGSSFNAATMTITLPYGALASLAHQGLDISYSLPLNVPVGTQLTVSANAPLAGDLVPGDNSITTESIVVSSSDPNDLAVSYARLTPAQVAAGQPLDYTVRFQNIGTDTAFVVVIQDTLDFRKLNLGSLQLVAQSHNCTWSLSGQGLLTVRFLNVKLPYRNVDVIHSQGFVCFRVQPRTTLALGGIIPNHARIVFDYNDPVRTNTVTTTVLLPAAVLNHHQALAWDAYPNPASGWLNIAAELPSAGSVTLQLLDALGRHVQQHTLAAPAGAFRQALDVSPLAPGLYVLHLRLPDGTVQVRQVVRE